MDRTLGVKAKIGRSNCLSPQTLRIGDVEVRGIQNCDPGSRSGLNDTGSDHQKWLPGRLGSEVGRHVRSAEEQGGRLDVRAGYFPQSRDGLGSLDERDYFR